MDPVTKLWRTDLKTLMDAAILLYGPREGKGKSAKSAAPVAAIHTGDSGGAKFQVDKPAGDAAGGGGKKRRSRSKKAKGSGGGSSAGGGGASSSGNAAKKKALACYVCGGPHKAMECPNKHSANKASDRLPSSADEPSTSGREHLSQTCACHAVGPETVTELEQLSGCKFTDPHADGRRHVLIFDPAGDITC